MLSSLDEARDVAERLREAGKQVVTVNGAFDVLHAGHLDRLEEASLQGDVLMVGINSDASVREGKGEERPVMPAAARAALLAALACVDYVVEVDEPYADGAVPKALIAAVRPTVHVNGPDYGAPEDWVEWSVMQEVGARGYVVERRNDLSTTKLLEKL